MRLSKYFRAKANGPPYMPRIDVVGKEEQYLSKGERAALVDWKKREEKMLAQLSRLDDMVAVLRDFRLPSLLPAKDEE